MPFNRINALLFTVTMIGLSTITLEQESPCQFCYVKQPLEAPADCSPYKAPFIIIQCQVTGPAGAALDIKWYFESDVSSNKTVLHDSQNSHMIKIEKHFDSDTQQSLTSNLTVYQGNVQAGDYWCQVFHADRGLLEGQKLGISVEGDYGRNDPCEDADDLSSGAVMKCADIPISDSYTALGTASSTCPLTFRSSTSTITTDTNTLLLMPTTSYYNHDTTPGRVTIDSNTISASTRIRTHSRYSVPSESITGPSRQIIPIASNSPSSDSTVLNDTKQAQTWLFVVVGLSGMFLVLIIVLVIVFALLCLTGPTNSQKRPNDLDLRNRLDTITSPVTTDPPSRPLTSMTLQTDIPTAASHEANKLFAGYNPLDQDYEDIDDDDDIEDTAMMSNPRYHEQGPTIVGSSSMSIAITPASNLNQQQHQQTYTIPTDIEYSEIGAGMTDGGQHSSPSHTGYGKLDHSARPRQTYNPRINSPLLSGYRKLDHVHVSSGPATGTATTLPSNQSLMKSPGYANISVPSAGNGGPQHFRSISLPGSEYSNLNHNSNNNNNQSMATTPTTPATPMPSTPAAVTPTSKKYANFAIIEACDEEDGNEEEEVGHTSVSRHGSQDYQMLSDATTIDRSDPPNMKEEYEFLPICVCEDEQGTSVATPSPQSPGGSQHGVGRGGGSEVGLMKRHIESSLGRDLVEEKMSVISHCSSDFTGPFFFPHMANFDNNGQTGDRHVYRALELSTMEPSKGYTAVNIKDESK